MPKTKRPKGLRNCPTQIKAPSFRWAALPLVLVYALVFWGGYSIDDRAMAQANLDHRLEQPEVRRSFEGTLQTVLRNAITPNDIVGPDGVLQRVNTPNYEGLLTGPTLVVKPGDDLIINVINDFPPNPEQDRQSSQFPHDPYTTNLHTHGLLVTPTGVGDNVLREMPPFPETLDNNYHFKVSIPADHPTGTFWYHPHKHGSTSFQIYGGMAGFLIIEGGEDTLDLQPEVFEAEDVVIAFQAIRVLRDDAPPAGGAGPGETPFVNPEAVRFSTRGPDVLVEEELPPEDNEEENIEAALWGPYVNTNFWLTANGKVNPTHVMYEGEVQRWRLLNALAGHTLVITMQEHNLNIVSQDGLTLPEMRPVPHNPPPAVRISKRGYALDAGSRVDVLVKAGEPGTYLVQAIDARFPPLQPDRDPRDDMVAFNMTTVTAQNIGAPFRTSQVANAIPLNANNQMNPDNQPFPFTLMTVVVREAEEGEEEMALPSTPLPVDEHLRNLQDIIHGEGVTVDAKRNVSFELCGQNQGALQFPLDTCLEFRRRYEAQYWGGIRFDNFAMMRDFDDTMLIKEGLFTASQNLFEDMYAGNVEEWTIHNRTFSDHPFHIHQNPFLVTHIDGIKLPVPEWHDTILVPSAGPNTMRGDLRFTDINDAVPGTVTFRTYFDPRTQGRFVAHCHILTHEDVGMMQALEIKERPPATSAQN